MNEVARCRSCNAPIDYGGISRHARECKRLRRFMPGRSEMTLDHAIRVLNSRSHRQWQLWYQVGEFIAGGDQYDYITPFEAIAIAEKYEREGQ